MPDSKRLDRKLPDILDGYIAYQENTEPPLIYKKWAGVSMMAAAMQRKCYLKWGPYNFYPNMYIVLVGPPGKSRKGTAMKPAKTHLAHLKIATAAEATTKEALIRRIMNSLETYNDSDKPGMLATKTHCSLTVFSDELTVFLGYSNRELMANLADWFDCADSWIYDTVGRGEETITNLFVNILGATTPELMQATMPMELMGGGLSSRMIFVYAPKKGKRVPYPGMSEADEQMCKDVEHDLESVFQMHGRFTADPNFIEAWIKWYTGKPETCPLPCRHLDYYWERREVHLLKLCMIMSASRSNEKVIRVVDFERADRWLTEAEQTMSSAFQGMGHRNDASVVSLLLNEIADKGKCHISELAGQFAYDMTSDNMMDMLTHFVSAGYITIKRNNVENKNDITIIHRDYKEE